MYEDEDLIRLDKTAPFDLISRLGANQAPGDVICSNCGEPTERCWFMDPGECNPEGVIKHGLWGALPGDPCGPKAYLVKLDACPFCENAKSWEWGPEPWEFESEEPPPDTPSLDIEGWWFQAGF